MGELFQISLSPFGVGGTQYNFSLEENHEYIDLRRHL